MSNDLNQCTFIGRLGADVEMRFMTSGDAVASFSIAVGSQWKDKTSGEKQESVEWVNVTAFGKLAEICGKYLKKGSQIYLSGRMKTDKYEKDGITRYSTKIIADTMQMLGAKHEGTPQSDTGISKPEQVARPDKPPVSGGGFDNFDDDIPF